MAVIALAAVAYAAAAYTGYALVGYAVYAIGSQLLKKPAPNTFNIQPPLADLRVMRTEYGSPIPYIRGSLGLAGDPWWNSDLQPTEHWTAQGGGGGKGGGGGGTQYTKTITYKIDVLFGLANNIGKGVARIFENGVLIFTADVGASTASLAASTAGDKWDRMTFYDGNDAQLPDPTYEAAVGIGNAPAYRGRSCVMIQGLNCGQSGQMRNLTFEFVADGTDSGETVGSILEGTDGLNQFATGTVSVRPGPSGYRNLGHVWVTHFTGGTEYQLELRDLMTGTLLYSVGTDQFRHFSYLGINATDWENCAIIIGDTGKLWHINGYTGEIVSANTTGLNVHQIAADHDKNVWAVCDGGLKRIFTNQWAGNQAANWQSTSIAPQWNHFCRNAAMIPGRVYGCCIGTTEVAYVDRITLQQTLTGIISNPGSAFPALIGQDLHIYNAVSGGGGSTTTIWKHTLEGGPQGSITLPGAHAIHLLDTAGYLWCHVSNDDAQDWIVIETATMTVARTVASGNFNQIVAELSVGHPGFFKLAATLGNWGNFGVLEGVARITKGTLSVMELQRAICRECGMDDDMFDVTALASITKPIGSFAWAGGATGRNATEIAMASHFYEVVQGEKAKFIPRGRAPVATLTYAELGASLGGDVEEPFSLKDSNDLEFPAQIALTYVNIENDYQTDTQLSDRLVSSAAGTLSTVSMAQGMTPAEAKAVADTMLLDQIASRFSATIALMGDRAYLEPTDVVIVTGADGSQFRMRLVRKQDSFPLLKFDAILDDPSVLQSQGITDTDYTSSTSVTPPAATIFRLMDIPILQDADDNGGIYGAAKGNTLTYPGAALFTCADNVEFDFKVTVDESAVFGKASTALGNWTGPRVFDEINSVTVDVGLGVLASSIRDTILNSLTVNAMLIGDEIIQFKTATLVAPGIYTLTGLLRGGRGTEWAMTGHSINERVVLLQAAGIRRITMTNSEIGQPRFVKAVTKGRALSTAPSLPFTNYGVGLMPFAPVRPTVFRDTANNATLGCQRRSRLEVRKTGLLGINVPLGEETESYEWTIYTNSSYTSVVRKLYSSVPSVQYLAATQTADGLTPANTLYATVCQRSATVLNGYPLAIAA